MKKYLALSLLLAVFVASVGCTKPEAPKTPASPAAATSGAPMASPSAAPIGAPASAAPAAGPTTTLPGRAGLALSVPEGWKAESTAEVTSVTSPDMKVNFLVVAKKGNEFEAIKAGPDKLLPGVTELKIDKATEKTDLLNGVKTWVVAGTGKAGPKDMEWALWAYEAPNKDYMIVLVAGDLKANLAALEAIQKSVKPAPPSTEVKPEAGLASPEAKASDDKAASEAKEGDDKAAPEAKEGDDKAAPGAKEGDDKAAPEAKEEGDKEEGDKEDAKEEGGK